MKNNNGLMIRIQAEKGIKMSAGNKKDMDSIRLEAAEPADAKILTEIQVRAYEAEVKKYGQGPLGYDSVETTSYRIRNRHYFKIIWNGSVVGGVFVFYRGGRTAILDGIFIDRIHQNKGIASEVMMRLEEKFPEAVVWSTETPLDSPCNIYFYKKHGYDVIGEKEGFLCLLHKYRKEPAFQYVNQRQSPAVFAAMDLKMAELDYVDLSNSELSHIHMPGSHFVYSYMDAVAIYDSSMRGSEFKNVAFTGEPEAPGSEFTNCFMGHTRFFQSELSETKAESCSLKKVQIYDCDLEGMEIKNSNYTGMKIDGIPVTDLLAAYSEKKKSGR